MSPDPFSGRERERPEWEATDPDRAGPVLANLGTIARAQVVNAINVQLIGELVELIEQMGGEAKLRPGFGTRMGRLSVRTRFLYDDESEHKGGSYLVTVEPTTPERMHPGVGTRWQRMEGPKRDQDWRYYEVDDADPEYVTLVPITETGERVEGKLSLRAKTDYLRRGIGWRFWSPPPEAIEALGGQE